MPLAVILVTAAAAFQHGKLSSNVPGCLATHSARVRWTCVPSHAHCGRRRSAAVRLAANSGETSDALLEVSSIDAIDPLRDALAGLVVAFSQLSKAIACGTRRAFGDGSN